MELGDRYLHSALASEGRKKDCIRHKIAHKTFDRVRNGQNFILDNNRMLNPPSLIETKPPRAGKSNGFQAKWHRRIVRGQVGLFATVCAGDDVVHTHDD